MTQTKLRDVMTPKEMKGILSMVALNKLWPKEEIRREWNIGKLSIEFCWRSSKNLWGRFGGGWNWKLGFAASGSTILLHILIFTIMIWKRKDNLTTPEN